MIMDRGCRPSSGGKQRLVRLGLAGKAQGFVIVRWKQGGAKRLTRIKRVHSPFGPLGPNQIQIQDEASSSCPSSRSTESKSRSKVLWLALLQHWRNVPSLHRISIIAHQFNDAVLDPPVISITLRCSSFTFMRPSTEFVTHHFRSSSPRFGIEITLVQAFTSSTTIKDEESRPNTDWNKIGDSLFRHGGNNRCELWIDPLLPRFRSCFFFFILLLTPAMSCELIMLNHCERGSIVAWGIVNRGARLSCGQQWRYGLKEERTRVGYEPLENLQKYRCRLQCPFIGFNLVHSVSSVNYFLFISVKR